MQTLSLLVELLLGFVPIIVIVVAVTTGLWAATKLFPKFGVMADSMFDGLFGVDAEYDEQHNTGYRTSNR